MRSLLSRSLLVIGCSMAISISIALADTHATTTVPVEDKTTVTTHHKTKATKNNWCHHHRTRCWWHKHMD